MPDTNLIDEAGNTRKLSDWRGQTLAVTFIYTRCPLPEFCPRMDRNFAGVQRDINGDPRLRGRVRLLSVSFDPDFDTPAVLTAHARGVGADPAVWVFATAKREDIDKFAARFGVVVMRQDPGNVEIVHNLRTAVIGEDGRLVTVLSGNEWTSSDLVAALRKAGAAR